MAAWKLWVAGLFFVVGIPSFASEQGVLGYVKELALEAGESEARVLFLGNYIDGNTVSMNLRLPLSEECGSLSGRMFKMLQSALIENKRVELYYKVPIPRDNVPIIFRVKLKQN
jgi:hypothetical protein